MVQYAGKLCKIEIFFDESAKLFNSSQFCTLVWVLNRSPGWDSELHLKIGLQKAKLDKTKNPLMSSRGMKLNPPGCKIVSPGGKLSPPGYKSDSPGCKSEFPRVWIWVPPGCKIISPGGNLGLFSPWIEEKFVPHISDLNLPHFVDFS